MELKLWKLMKTEPKIVKMFEDAVIKRSLK